MGMAREQHGMCELALTVFAVTDTNDKEKEKFSTTVVGRWSVKTLIFIGVKFNVQ
jgi:hypothetical protein